MRAATEPGSPSEHRLGAILRNGSSRSAASSSQLFDETRSWSSEQDEELGPGPGERRVTTVAATTGSSQHGRACLRPRQDIQQFGEMAGWREAIAA